MTTSTTACARVLALILLASLAVACGGKQEKAAKSETAAVDVKKSSIAARAPADAPAASTADGARANAVALGKTGAAVDLKYEIGSKPTIGQPFEVELVFVPRLAADLLEIEAAGMTGLTLSSVGTTKFENVIAGERYATKLLVLVAQPGLYYIGVTAKMSTRVQTDARTFSVPVVAGTLPAPEKPAAAPMSSGADSGAQPVKSMQAVETTGKDEKK